MTNSESTGSNYLRLHEIYSVADNNIFFVIQCNQSKDSIVLSFNMHHTGNRFTLKIFKTAALRVVHLVRETKTKLPKK